MNKINYNVLANRRQNSLSSHYQETWRRFSFDLILVVCLVVLCLFGLMILYSASGGNMMLVKRQFIYLCIGFMLMFLVAQVHVDVYRRFYWQLYFLSIIMLVMLFFVGKSINGSTRWFDLYFFSFQPSESMRLVMPIFVSSLLVQAAGSSKSLQTLLLIFCILLPCGLIYMQPDLGTAIIVAFSAFWVIFVAGFSWIWLAAIFSAFLISLPLIWRFVLMDYHKERILVLLSPELDPYGTGWSMIQSKVAIGSGGFWGKGWLNGTQGQLDFLPESHTDFIFSVFAEEFGFLGVLLLFSLYSVIVVRCLYIAYRAGNVFDSFLVASIGLTFFLYWSINIAMVSGLFPTIGVSLPMVGYGGSSLVVSLIGFGIVMSVHNHIRLT